MILTFVFINNFIFTYFLGICPFVGASKEMLPAVGTGMALTFIMTVTTLLCWLINRFILIPLGAVFLQTLFFLLIAVSFVQILEMMMKKFTPLLFQALGIFFPMLTANCAVLGIALIAVKGNYTATESVVAGFSAGGGFLLAIVLMAAIREKMNMEWIPKPFRGEPIAFISAGLIALAFMAFDKVLLKNMIG